jgi:hypothetical protein
MKFPGIEDIARMVAQDINAGRNFPALNEIGELLGFDPSAPSALLEALIADCGAKKRKKGMAAAYGELFGAVMGTLRMQMENGSKAAGRTIDSLVKRITEAGKAGLLDGDTLLSLGGHMSGARISASAELKGVIEDSAMAGPREDFTPQDMEDTMAKLAADFGNDPFQTFAQMAEMTAVMPDAARGALAGLLLHAKSAALREAALGYLLDPTLAVAAEAGAALQAAAGGGLLSAAGQRYLILLRPWLSGPPR